MTKQLTPLMEQVISVLAQHDPRTMTANDIARACGYRRGQANGRHSHNGRAMAVAQRVIHPLIGLISRRLVVREGRRDGLSDTAFTLTSAGRDKARELAREPSHV